MVEMMGISNSDHLRTTFLLIASYFLAHLCIISLLVQTLKKDKNTHSKWKHAFKMEIRSNLGWKYGTLLIVDGVLVSKGSFYHIFNLIEIKYSTYTIHQRLARIF